VFLVLQAHLVLAEHHRQFRVLRVHLVLLEQVYKDLLVLKGQQVPLVLLVLKAIKVIKVCRVLEVYRVLLEQVYKDLLVLQVQVYQELSYMLHLAEALQYIL
jgi:hypothetical protein